MQWFFGALYVALLIYVIVLLLRLVFDWIQEQSGPAPGKSAGRGPVSGRWPDDPVFELVGQTPPLV